MPTQTIIATIRGSGDVLRSEIISPAYLMATIEGHARVNALVGATYLPGATAASASLVTASTLGLGHVLSLEGGLSFGGASVAANAVSLSLTGGLTFGGTSGLMAEEPELNDLAGGLTIGGELLLSTGPAFSMF